MKNKSFKLFSLIIFVFTCQLSFATHIMGGEITWQCQPNGQFIFQVALYRDCGTTSATLPLSVTLPNTAGVSIACPLINKELATPKCNPSDSAFQCGSTASGEGAVEKGIYKSAPITLTGVPPAGGWYFSYYNCCRPAGIINISTSTSAVHLRAFMYPYVNPNGLPISTNPCYNSSPKFLENPLIVSCNGEDVVYNNIVVDIDGDSLYYDWAESLKSINDPVNYTAGYSYTSPLPSTFQNPANKNAYLDHRSGQLRFKSYTTGGFVIAFKIEEWRKGQKIGEYFRDLNTIIKPCNPYLDTCNSDSNNRPSLKIEPLKVIPFTAVTGPYNDTDYYKVKVLAGSSVSLKILSKDLDSLSSCNEQSIAFSGFGAALSQDSIYTDTNDCSFPTCATITSQNPMGSFTSIKNNTLLFNWVTKPHHAYTNNWQVGDTIKAEYDFFFKVRDNWCPQPSFNYTNLKIEVWKLKPNVSIDQISIHSIEVFPNPASNTLIIDGDFNSKFDAVLFDSQGREILKTRERQIDVSELKEGLYLLQLKIGEIVSLKKVQIARE